MIQQDSKFVLHADCVLCKGTSRSTINDLKTTQIYPIPNSLYEILKDHGGKSIVQIKAFYNNVYDEIIDEYFEFLVEKKLVWFPSSLEIIESLIPLDLTYNSPSKIENCILDLGDNYNLLDVQSLIHQLDELCCNSIHIRCFTNNFTIKTLEEITHSFENMSIIDIEFLIQSNEQINPENLNCLCDKYARITRINVLGHTEDLSLESFQYSTPIQFSKQEIKSDRHCGKIGTSNFITNTIFYSEAQNHNTCLNRKIGIDLDGNIKNCPSMPKIYGNIKRNLLKDVLKDNSFQELWSINKDKIDKCKDCEFRYVCTDCRAFIEIPDNIYSAPIKCGYDPVSNEWTDWSTNPLKLSAISYYRLGEIL